VIKLPHACAYLRTSSRTNCGEDKDSDKRQMAAIKAYAKGRYQITGVFYDAAVSGADPIHTRAGFSDMLALIDEGGPRTILVETAGRFARQLIVQELGAMELRQQGVELIAVDKPELFTNGEPMNVMVRHIVGAMHEYEKTALVEKLRVARQRKRERTGKAEGRKSHAQLNPQATTIANELRAQGASYRTISNELAARGHLNTRGRPYSTSAVYSMLKIKAPRS